MKRRKRKKEWLENTMNAEKKREREKKLM